MKNEDNLCCICYYAIKKGEFKTPKHLFSKVYRYKWAHTSCHLKEKVDIENEKKHLTDIPKVDYNS